MANFTHNHLTFSNEEMRLGLGTYLSYFLFKFHSNVDLSTTIFRNEYVSLCKLHYTHDAFASVALAMDRS